MSENKLEKCPKCQGSMRPTGNVQTQGIAQEPFGEAPDIREYECNSCGYHSDMTDRNSS
jgi:hypothetical protein